MNGKWGMAVATAALGFCAAGSALAQTTVVGFENGDEGWSGNATIEPTGGNPDANAHFLIENFGIEIRNDTNPAFVGDFTGAPSVTVGIDSLVNSIQFEGIEVPRELVVEFRSSALAEDGYPYSSVWYDLGTIAAGTEWSTWSVTFDPSSTTLPAGWGGYGAEDPETFEPILPADLTFADIMANTDELAFTTYEPGYFYGFTDFDVRWDNVSITLGAADDIFASGFEPR